MTTTFTIGRRKPVNIKNEDSPELKLEEIIRQFGCVPDDGFFESFEYLDRDFYQWFINHREKVKKVREEESRRRLATSRFTLYELAGRGCWGDVYKAKDNATDEIVAVKLLNPNELAREQMRERKLTPFKVMKNESGLAECSHVVPRSFEIDEKGKPFIVMPYYERFLNKVLHDENNSGRRNHVGDWLDYETARGYILDIAKGLSEMHTIRKRVHGDLKPDNIALKKLDETHERALISDLGTSTCGSFGWTVSPRDNVGFVYTRAPENFKKGQENQKESHKTKQSDNYALAAITYRIFTGEYPLERELRENSRFFEENGEKEVNKITRRKVKKAKNIPRKLRKVILDNLAYDPWKRDKDAQVMHERIEDAMKDADLRKFFWKSAKIGLLYVGLPIIGLLYFDYKGKLHEPLHLGMPEEVLRGVPYQIVDGEKPVEFESERLEDLPEVKIGLTDEKSDRRAKKWTQNRNVAYLVKTHYQAWKHLNPPKECLWGYGHTNENLISENQWKVHIQRIHESRDTMAPRPENDPELCWTYAINQGLNYSRNRDKVDLEDVMAIARVGLKPVEEAKRISKSFDWKDYRKAKYSDGKPVISEDEQKFVNTWLAYYHANVD